MSSDYWGSAKWDADLVRDDLRDYVVEHLGDDESGVLIVDETSFPKKGDKSVGVASQYAGTVGDTANSQVGVFLAYASNRGAAFIDRALYLPPAWAGDTERRLEAGVPEGVGFATKVELARRLLERAFNARVPAGWVVADSFYGRSHNLRRWLEQQGRAYALMIPKTNAVRYRGRRVRAERLGQQLSEDVWVSAPAQGGSPGQKPWEWACVELSDDSRVGMRRWLLMRRRPDDPNEVTFYQVYGPRDTLLGELVRICQSRWQVEECFAQAKGEVGLDQYEVRRWEAWHRYVTLCLLAHAFLVVVRSTAHRQESEGKRGISIPT